MTEQSTQHPDHGAPVPPDFRALCAKVIQYNEGQGKYNFSQLNALDRENAAFDAWQEIRSEIKHALAQPVPPIDGEVAELVDKCIATYAEDPRIITSGSYILIDDGKARADLIERLSPPQPVSVSERLPDTIRMDALRDQSWDLRCFDMPTGEGDADVGWRVIEHHMTAPHERVVAEVYEDDPRAAIDAALSAPIPGDNQQ